MSVTDDITAADAAAITHLPVEDIRPAEDNPRGSLGDLSDLANSIAATGVWQPIVVTPRPEDGKPQFLLVIGHRRHAAAIKAGKATIPAIIREMDEPTRLAAMFIENAQREDLTPVEEGRSLRALVSLGMSQREVAKKVGKSQAHISKRLSLLDLPEEIQAEVDTGRLPVGDAVELARLKDDKEIREVIKASRYDNPALNTVTYEGVARRVGNVLARQERERNVRKVARALRAEGVTVVEYPRGGGFTSAKTGKRLGDGYGHIDITPEQHATEPCHAAAVSPDAEVVYVCTDPDRHAPEPGTDNGQGNGDGGDAAPATPEQPTEPEDIEAHKARAEREAWAEWERRERERERAELDAAAERRSVFIADLLRRKPNNAVTTYVLTAFLEYAGASSRVLAWLGIDEAEPAAAMDAFRAYTAQSLANLTRAALAVVLDDGEGQIDNGGYVAFLDADVRDHFGYLLGNGYEPTDVERRGLDQGGEDDNDTDATDTDATDTDAGEGEGEADGEATADDAAEAEPTEGDANDGTAEAEPTEGDANDGTAEAEPTEGEANDGTAEAEPTDADADAEAADPDEAEQAGEEGDPA